MDHPAGTPQDRSAPPRARTALLVSVLIPAAAVALVALATGALWPPCGARPGRERRAAVAIRDDVTPFQKWGTRAFTQGQLAANYDRVDYITQSKGRFGQEEFVAAVDAALERYEVVDLFLLAHTNRYESWLQPIDAARRQKLRLVYDTGCFGAVGGAEWLELGADAFVGHPGKSESPVFYFYFLRRWLRGATVDDAVAASNADTKAVLAATGGLMYHGRPVDELWESTRAEELGDPSISIAGGGTR